MSLDIDHLLLHFYNICSKFILVFSYFSMQTYYINKNCELNYLWIFFPTKKIVLPDLLYSIEHHFIFLKNIKKYLGGLIHVPKNNVDLDVVSTYGGFWVCFTCYPKYLPKLLDLIKSIPKEKLTDLPIGEQKRMKIIKEENNDMDSFHQLSHNLQYKLIMQNNPASIIDPKKMWKNGFYFEEARALIVGPSCNDIQKKQWKIPNQKFNINLSVERKYLDWYEPVKEYTYNIFFVFKNTPISYVYMRIINRFFISFFSKKYIEKGKSSTLRSELWCEPYYILHGLDINTTDTVPAKFSFPSVISEKEYENLKTNCLFAELQNNDKLFYEEFPVLGFTPKDVITAFEKTSYQEFMKYYKNILNKYIYYWY